MFLLLKPFFCCQVSNCKKRQSCLYLTYTTNRMRAIAMKYIWQLSNHDCKQYLSSKYQTAKIAIWQIIEICSIFKFDEHFYKSENDKFYDTCQRSSAVIYRSGYCNGPNVCDISQNCFNFLSFQRVKVSNYTSFYYWSFDTYLDLTFITITCSDSWQNFFIKSLMRLSNYKKLF